NSRDEIAIETGHGWQLRKRGVRKRFGNDEGCERQAGDQVDANVLRGIRAHPAQCRYPGKARVEEWPVAHIRLRPDISRSQYDFYGKSQRSLICINIGPVQRCDARPPMGKTLACPGPRTEEYRRLRVPEQAPKATQAYCRGFRRLSVAVSLSPCCSGVWKPSSLWSGYQIRSPPTQGVIAVTAVTLIL